MLGGLWLPLTVQETSKVTFRYYPEPKAAANNIKGYVAFYKNKVEFQD